MNQLEVGAVGGDQRCSVGAGGQRDQNVKVQIAQLGRLEALIGSDCGKNLALFKPALLGRSQYRSAHLELLHKLLLGRKCSPSPQLCQHNRGISYPSRTRRNPLRMAGRALIVD